MRFEATSAWRHALMAGLLAPCMWGGLAASEPLAVEEILDRAAVDYAALRQEVDAQPAFVSASPVDPSRDVATDATLELIDLRLVMIQIAQVTGANGQLQVLRAQPEGRLKALSLRGGAMGLDTLLTRAGQLAPGAVNERKLSLPLAIQRDAELTLTDEEALWLDRAGGAFMVNFGRFETRGGVVLGTDDTNEGSAEFRPFLVTAGAGVFDAQETLFEGLGFGRNPAFAGVAVVSGGLYRAGEPSRLLSAQLRNVGSAHFGGVEAPEITDTLFADMRGTALDLRATRAARVSRNRFVDIAEGDAIELRDNATGTLIVGNQVFRAGKNGLHVLGASHGTLMRDNLVWQAGDSALSVDHADCALVYGLAALASGRRGVSLKLTRGSEMQDSIVVGSGSAGLFVGGQPSDTELRLSANRLAGNRIGLMTAGPGTLQLSGNDFSQQFPRFLKGDLQNEVTRLIGDLHGDSPMTLTAGGGADEYLPPLDCPTQSES